MCIQTSCLKGGVSESAGQKYLFHTEDGFILSHLPAYRRNTLDFKYEYTTAMLLLAWQTAERWRSSKDKTRRCAEQTNTAARFLLVLNILDWYDTYCVLLRVCICNTFSTFFHVEEFTLWAPHWTASQVWWGLYWVWHTHNHTASDLTS